MAMELTELLDVELNQTDIIPDHLLSEGVRERLKNMMDVIEETLRFIEARMNSYSLGKLPDHYYSDIFFLISANKGDRLTRATVLTSLKKKLRQASKSLDSCLIASVFAIVASSQRNENNTLLRDKLNPVLVARSSIDHGCLEGTRKAPLEHIMSWAKVIRNSSSRLYHVHGIAGSGKSSVASTVCRMLEEEDLLAGSFFCKRDLPDQRDTSRILPSLSYTLALRHEVYKECVMHSLKDEPDITSRSIEQQLKVLFREPLTKIARGGSRSQPLVFVIDALDECCDNHDASQRRLADGLCQISALASWLKVFVTSRPTDDLMWKLSPTDTRVLSINLNDMDTEKDIKLYTQASLKELVGEFRLSPSWLTEDTIQKLTDLASGLFIWASTMIRYIRGQLDKDNAMRLVLSGNALAAEASLDNLYMKVIESGGSDDDNVALKKTVLGIVFVTARNNPLSIDGLHDFLQRTGRKVSKAVLKAVINRLRSVLYEDTSKGNVIRVCHPSFVDFLEDPKRCGKYWTNVEQLHAVMVETSINLMTAKLRFNICDLQTASITNEDVSDLPQKIENNISESLLYSCRYWTTHFTEENRVTVSALVSEFFRGLKAIYWVEVLSLVDELKIGLGALQTVIDFFKVRSKYLVFY